MKDVLEIVRIFHAPVDKVWEACTKEDKVQHWWGPRAFTAPYCEIDLRVGGRNLCCMRSDTGPEIWRKGIWSGGVYKEIVPQRKIVTSDYFTDERGNPVSAAVYGIEHFPFELEITYLFEPLGPDQTRLTLRHAGMPDNMKDDCRTGWGESFDKLEELLQHENARA